MPRKKQTMKSRKRKPATKNRDMKAAFPPSVTVDLSYTHVRSFGSGTLTYIFNAYCYNSAYDPDYSGVGAQPVGYDQWSAFYSRYYIDTSTISVTASNATSTILIMGIIPLVDDTPPTDVQAAISNPNCIYDVLAPTGSGPTTKTLTMSSDIRKLYANPRINDALDDFTGATGNLGVGTSPTRNGFFHVFFATLNGTNVPVNAVQYVMKLSQHTKFMRRNDLALS